MAIPIRLNVGSGDESQIELNVQTIDMSVDRNASAFPTPFAGDLGRVAIDTNIPRVQIELAGTFEDDVVTTSSYEEQHSVRGSTVIDFSNALPVDANDLKNFHKSSGEGTLLEKMRYTVSGNYEENGNSVISASRAGMGQNDVDLSINLDTGLTDTYWKVTSGYASGSTSTIDISFGRKTSTGLDSSVMSFPDLIIPKVFLIGSLVTLSDGSYVGKISSTSGENTGSVTFTSPIATTLTADDQLYLKSRMFNAYAQEVGIVQYITSTDDGFDITLSSNNAVPLEQGDYIYVGSIPEVEDVMDDSELFIKLVPSYWAEDVSKSPYKRVMISDQGISETGKVQGIRFYFDSSLDYTHSFSISRTASANFPSQATGNEGDARFNLRIGNILSTTNPSEHLATKFAEAVNSSTNVMRAQDGNIVPPTILSLSNIKINQAFSATVYGSRVVVKQLYTPEINVNTGNAISDKYKEKFNVYSSSRANGKASANSTRSAGDKVQDIMGLVANSPADSEGMILGIQIPYQSLITSDGVTGITRNFFLTFGQVDVDSKGALANQRSASAGWNNLKILSDSEVGGEYEEQHSTNFGEYLGDVGDTIDSSISWLSNMVTDVWVTLTPGERGNDGGVRIIPEKLHVRYDAGNNYYAFNLILVASDYVIGV